MNWDFERTVKSSEHHYYGALEDDNLPLEPIHLWKDHDGEGHDNSSHHEENIEKEGTFVSAMAILDHLSVLLLKIFVMDQSLIELSVEESNHKEWCGDKYTESDECVD